MRAPGDERAQKMNDAVDPPIATDKKQPDENACFAGFNPLHFIGMDCSAAEHRQWTGKA